jgi:hypothetical protein
LKPAAKLLRQTAKSCQYLKKNVISLHESAFFSLADGLCAYGLEVIGEMPNEMRG